MGKVVIIGGNKRAGKTTIANKLHKDYGFNYYNYDMLLDALEESLPVLNDSNDAKYIKLLESMVKRSLDDAKNYNIDSVYDYFFTPEELADFKYRDDVKIIFLSNMDATLDNIAQDFKEYSQEYDWPSYVSEEDINRNIDWILKQNELLDTQSKKYNFKLFNTSRGENRNKRINAIINYILED